MLDGNIQYTEREKELFNYLFLTYKNPSSDFIDGGEFAGLMRKSNLDKVFNNSKK